MAALTSAIMVSSIFSNYANRWYSLTAAIGHAGAMLQARRLGDFLCVGVHSDEEIMDNKGPTVMTLKER